MVSEHSQFDADRNTSRVGTETVRVVVAFDQALFRQAGALFQNLSAVLTGPASIFALTRGVSTRAMLLMDRCFPDLDFSFIPMDKFELPAAKLLRHTSPSTLDRLYIHRLVTPGKILYLDIDTLPLQDPLSVWSENRGALVLGRPNYSETWSNPFAVIREHVAREESLNESEVFQFFGRLESARTFNAGVLGLDTASSAVSRGMDKAISAVERYGFNDQFALNFTLHQLLTPMEPGWNYWPLFDVSSEEPRIVHWIGGRKPWAHPFVPWRLRYLKSEREFMRRLKVAQRSLRLSPKQARF